jgi:hypothetical protein
MSEKQWTIHCKHGHEFIPENTRVNPRGSCECRACHRYGYVCRMAIVRNNIPSIDQA